ncbi:MAG: hypothetical protein K9J30_10565 [Bacteroidales bacterium]|nr:hypothetical protein [Bacteroidales bacterium]
MLLKAENLKYLIIILLVITVKNSFCQTDYQWWNEKHDWDGSTHWTHYMIITPAYLGPNALPVPEMYPGRIPSRHFFEMGAEGHYSKGDQTANLYLNYDLPLFTDKATFQLTYRPVEFYKTDTITRDLRRSREYDPAGRSSGDLYMSTYIQLIRDHAYLPDVMVSANIKTASGSKLYAARHTDTPGYWADATIGKGFRISETGLQQLHIYGKAGFYAYQTFSMRNFQNDAFLYGGGFLLKFRDFSLQNQITGYYGYFKLGDHPVVYRLILSKDTKRKVSFKVMFQQGLNDYNFSTIRFTARYKLSSPY